MFGFADSKKIDKYYQERNWNAVIETAEKLFKNGTADIKILNDLAVAYKKAGRNDEAELVCQRIYETNPTNDVLKESVNLGLRYMRYHLVMGELLYMKGEYAEALGILNQLKLIGSHFSDKFYILAKIFIKKNQYDKALDEYNNLFRLCAHRFNTAIQGFVEIIELDALNEDAYKSLFEAYKKKGMLDKATAEYETASKNGKDSISRYILGHLYYYTGRIKESIAKYSEFVSLNPDDTNLPFFLAHIYLENNDITNAINIFRELILKDPSKLRNVTSLLEKSLIHKSDGKQTVWILDALVEFYSITREFISAEIVLSKLLKLKPNDNSYQDKLKTLLANAIEQYIQDGKLDTAKDELHKYENLGLDLYSEKRYEELNKRLTEARVKNLEEILSKGGISEDNATKIRYELATLYTGKGDDRAIPLLQMVERTPFEHQVDVQFLLGMSLAKKGIQKIAEEYFDKVIKANISMDKKVGFLYQIGTTYEELGFLEKAKTVYNEVISHSIGYRDIVKRLETVNKGIKLKKAMSTTDTKLEDRYEDIQPIGQGTIGTVYKAVDKILKRRVALKVIKDEYKENKDALEKFIKETQTVSLFKHPGLTTIYDINIGKVFYIVMDYIEGESLTALIKRGILPVKDAVKIALNVCDALTYAHQQGIIHRNIKPNNIIIMKNCQIKIADFGLAQLMTTSSDTMNRHTTITPLYMSPEQIKGNPIDHRSDIYSFGIILYEMITGKPPFFDGDIAYKQVNEEPKPPTIFDSGIPRWLENIVLKCIKKKPEDRYQQTEHLLKELKSYSKFVMD